MATITAIETQKRRPDRVNIDLDGEYAFGLPAILAVGLRVGARLDADQVAALESRDAEEGAYQRALKLLGRRERSESELRTYLLKHKIPEDIVERTLKRLRDHQHTDDAAFARAWVENRNTFRPRGRRALAWELNRKGVSTEVAAQALGQIDESALAVEAGFKKARQLPAAAWPEFRTKVSAYLARRGFPTDVITPTVSRLWSDTHPGQDSPHEEETP